MPDNSYELALKLQSWLIKSHNLCLLIYSYCRQQALKQRRKTKSENSSPSARLDPMKLIHVKHCLYTRCYQK